MQPRKNRINSLSSVVVDKVVLSSEGWLLDIIWCSLARPPNFTGHHCQCKATQFGLCDRFLLIPFIVTGRLVLKAVFELSGCILSHSSRAAPEMTMSVRRLVSHCGPNRNVSQTIGCIVTMCGSLWCFPILSSGTMRSTFGELSQQILHGSWSFKPSVKNKTSN